MVFAARLALLALSVVGVRAGKMVEGDACEYVLCPQHRNHGRS
jgi:hypothetical protein